MTESYEDRLKKFNELKACPSCGNLLFEINGEKTCLKCGTKFYRPPENFESYEMMETKPVRR